jgi:hypothetical protein
MEKNGMNEAIFQFCNSIAENGKPEKNSDSTVSLLYKECTGLTHVILLMKREKRKKVGVKSFS